MTLEELINKHGPDGIIPLFVQGNGRFTGPGGIKGKWKDYEQDQSKVLLLADDGTIATCPRMNLVDEQTVESIEYQQNRTGGDRYNLDESYTESFFGWDDNASQQKILAQYFVPKIVEIFKPKYVVDIGCGTGQWLDEYRKFGVLTKGIEGSINAFIEMSEETKKTVLKWDLRDRIEKENNNVDFVQSFEVAEHIEEEYADIFIHHLVRDNPDTILLTAARPGQHGHQHVNCKERKYWEDKMKNNGYLFEQDLLNEIKEWGTPKDCPDWWSQNLMVFI